MFPPWLHDPKVYGPAAAALVIVVGVITYLLMRKKESADEAERRRRDALLQSGRIIDGMVLDITDIDSPAGPRRHVFYRYDIAGVGYECSQDVTALTSKMEGATSTPGMPASVRYDPHNPSNSIVIAETWTGLHYSYTPVAPTRPVARIPQATR
jgi:hypothetical protein